MNPRSRSLNIQGIVLVGMLVAQYVLGMYVNLFVQFPEGANAGQLWEFSWRQFALASHIVLGLLLFIGAIAFLVRAIRFHSAAWKVPSILGFLGIFFGMLGGVLFIPTQTDSYSYLMSLAFLLSLVSYGWGIFAAREEAIAER